MNESEDKRYRDALAKGWEDLRSRKLSEVAELSGAEVSGDSIQINILNRKAVVNTGSEKIMWADGSEMEGDLQVLLLHYLLKAEGKVDNNWSSYREFEGGNLYYSVFQGRAITPLISTFGENPEAFIKAGEAFGGSKVSRGDASLNFLFFPYLLINITIWEGDEEVPGSANIIFDSAAGRILPAEDIAHLSAELVELIRRSQK